LAIAQTHFVDVAGPSFPNNGKNVWEKFCDKKKGKNV
jgi:hypothetical protein